MNENFNLLLRKIRTGDVTQGTYLRHSVERNSMINFEKLTVSTSNGLEVDTGDGQAYDAFIDLVKHQRCCELRCRYYPKEECYRFEILGHWQAVNCK